MELFLAITGLGRDVGDIVGHQDPYDCSSKVLKSYNYSNFRSNWHRPSGCCYKCGLPYKEPFDHPHTRGARLKDLPCEDDKTIKPLLFLIWDNVDIRKSLVGKVDPSKISSTDDLDGYLDWLGSRNSKADMRKSFNHMELLYHLSLLSNGV